MKIENIDIQIITFFKGTKKTKESNVYSKISTTYNKRLFIKILIILFFTISHIYIYLFLNNINTLKIRKLSPDSIITITLSIDTVGESIFICDVKDKRPNKIYINDFDVTSTVRLGGKKGTDLKYAFPSVGEYTVKVVWYEPITSCDYMFYYLTYVKKIDLSKFDSSQVVNMEGMFYQCQGVTEINLENFDTSQVTTMHRMFLGCLLLTSLDVSSFKTSKVENMTQLFDYNRELTSLDLTSFDVSKVKSMKLMFRECFKLKYIKFGNFNTQNVIDASSMFKDCSSLLSIDLSTFDTSHMENMNSMFLRCSSLETIDLSSFRASSCKNIYSMFSGCTKLKSIDLSNFDVSKITDMNSLFSNCENLQYINMQRLDTSTVTNMHNMFDGCTSLKYLNLDTFNENANVNLTNIFNDISEDLTYCIKDTSKARNIIKILDEKNAENDCFDLCFSENNVYDFDLNSCTGNCSPSAQYKYKNKCYPNCENFNLFYNYNEKECIDDIPKGYYRKSIYTNYLEKCPIKCKECSIDSINDNNLCTSCNNNYYLLSINSYYECYETCPEGYINSFQRTCEIYTTVPKAPVNTVPLITEPLATSPLTMAPLTTIPLDGAPLTTMLLTNAPLTTLPSTSSPLTNIPLTTESTKGKFTEKLTDFITDKLTEINSIIMNCENALYEKDNKCIEECSAFEFLHNECKGINNSLIVKTNIINNIREGIVNGNLSSLLANVTGKERRDIEVIDNDIIYQITSTFNQENNEYNNTSVIKF